LEKQQDIFQHFFHCFVAQPYLGKVTKTHPYIPSGYGAALKKTGLGVILPPGGYIKVKTNRPVIHSGQTVTFVPTTLWVNLVPFGRYTWERAVWQLVLSVEFLLSRDQTDGARTS